MADDRAGAARQADGPREALLSVMFVRLADTLATDVDVEVALTDLCYLCVDLLGASAAGVLLAHPDRGLQVAAASDAGGHLLELYQLEAAAGPCLDAFTTRLPVHVEDLESSGAAWPAFSAVAVDLGFRAVEAFPMLLRDEVVGALNLFYREARVASPRDTEAARALADMATIGLLQLRRFRDRAGVAEQLQHALASRVTIEQAKGMLAADGGLDLPQAFEVLRRYARDHNQKLTAVAEQVTAREIAAETLLQDRDADRGRPD